MTVIPLNIGTQSNPGRYGQDGNARLINCYVEDAGKEAKHPLPVYASAGLADFATLTDGGAVRAMIDVDQYLFPVAGRSILRVSTAGSVLRIGGMGVDGHVTMARNRRSPTPQIAIVCEGITKVVTGTIVTDLSDSDLPPPNSVFDLGGFFVFTIKDGRFFITGIDDITVDALDFASAEANPDGLVIGKALGQNAVLFGNRSIEFWTLTGAADFPFSRAHVINVGCYAAGSVAEIPIITGTVVTDSLAFASTDRQGSYAGICILENLSARVISTHAVDRAVRDEPDITSITSCGWSDGGHAFYCISGSTFSWCWDSRTGQWHERESYGLARWKVGTIRNLGGRLIAGDYTSNKLYHMSNDYKNEAGSPLIMTVQTPPVVDYPNALEFHRAFFDAIPHGPGLVDEEYQESETELLAWDDEDPLAWDDEDPMAWDTVAGITLTANVDPQAMLSWSDDGINFGSQRLLKLGRMGETMKHPPCTRLGQTKRGAARTFRFSVSADVAKGLMGAAVDITSIAA